LNIEVNNLRVDGGHAPAGQLSDGKVDALVAGVARRLREFGGCQRRKSDAIGGHQNVHYPRSAVRLVTYTDKVLVVIEDAKSGYGIHTVKNGVEGRTRIACDSTPHYPIRAGAVGWTGGESNAVGVGTA
jgi:hypothetical protein